MRKVYLYETDKEEDLVNFMNDPANNVVEIVHLEAWDKQLHIHWVLLYHTEKA